MLFVFRPLLLIAFWISYFALSAPTNKEDVDLIDLTTDSDATLVMPLQRRAPASGEYLDLPAIANHMRAKHGFPTIDYEQPEESDRLQRRINFNLVELFDDGPDLSYFATIGVGTPPKKFNVILDTGSSDLFLSSSICTKGCEKSVVYNPANSRTSQVQGKTIDLTLGSAKISGELAADIALLGGFKVHPQTFVMASSIQGEVFSPRVHGLLGLGFQPLAKTGAVPFVEALVNNKKLKQPVMTFYLQRHLNDNDDNDVAFGGNLTLGDIPSSIGLIESHPIDVPNLWAISLETITSQGVPIAVPSTSSKAIIDTGSTLIGAPSNVFNTVCQRLGGTPRTSGRLTGFCVISCNLDHSSLEMSFTFTGGKAWPLNPADLVYPQSDGKNGRVCVSPIFDLLLQIGSGPAPSVSWLIGLPFLKNVYSIFDFNPPSVGFAALPSHIPPAKPRKKLGSGKNSPPTSGSGTASSLKSSPGSSSGASSASGVTGSIANPNSGTGSGGSKLPCINGKILGKFAC